MTRILQVVTLATPGNAYGGPIRVAVNQSQQLRLMGLEVELIAGQSGYGYSPSEVSFDQEAIRTFKVHRFLSKKSFAFYFSIKMIRWLWANVTKFDLVHYHFARDLIMVPAAVIAIWKRVPFVVQTHGMVLPSDKLIVRLIDFLLVRKILRAASRTLSLTEHETKALLDVEPLADVYVLPNGIKINSEECFDYKKNQVLFLARLHKRKRPLEFIKIAEALSSTHPDTSFILAGPDAGEGPEVKRAIRNLRSGAKVDWIGPVDPDKTNLLFRNSSIYVLPSVGEIVPMTILEALNHDSAVVATSDMYLATALKDRRAAIITNPDIDSLVEAVRLLLNSDKLRNQTAKAGRKFLETELNIKVVCQKLAKVYAIAIHEKGNL